MSSDMFCQNAKRDIFASKSEMLRVAQRCGGFSPISRKAKG
jgi:hypothetical protein